MEIFKLMGSIFIDNKAANESLRKTDSLGSKVAKSLGEGVKYAAKFGVMLTGIATAGTTALISISKKSADTADRIDKMSQRLSMSRETFQEWDYIMSQNGVSIDSFQTGMKKFTQVLDGVNNGSSKTIDIMNKLDPQLVKTAKSGATQEQVFRETVKAFQKMPEGVEKARLAQELFGKQGQEMLPMLNASKGSIDELTKKAHEMGLILSDDAVNAGVKFTDTLDSVKRSLSSVVAKIGVSIMPIVQKFLDWILLNMPTIQKVVGVVFENIGLFVQKAVNFFNENLLPVFQSFFEWVSTNWPQISSTISVVFDTLLAVLDPIISFFSSLIGYMMNFSDSMNLTIPILLGLVAGLIAFKTAILISSIISTVRNGIILFTTATQGLSVAQAILNAVMMANPFAVVAVIIGALIAVGVLLYKNWDKIVAFAKQMGVKLGEIWNSIKNKVSEVWNGIKNTISSVWNNITGFVSNAINSIKSTVTSVFDGLKSTVTTIWNGIKKAISSPIESAFGIVKSIVDKIKGVFNFKFQWPHIPLPHFRITGSANPLRWLKEGVPKLSVQWYAKGGIFDKPTIFNTPYGLKGVGEAGPEAVTPISKLTEYVKDAVKSENGVLVERVDMLINLFKEFLTTFKSSKGEIYFNSEKVGEVLNPIFARMIKEGDF